VAYVKDVLVAIAIGCSALALAAAPPASADAVDQQFLQVLNANGLGCGQGAFECTQGDDDMIQVGRSICRQMRGGNSKLSIEQQIIRMEPKMQPTQAVVLVTAAEAAYCP
jgi:hypothetical protein